jgi:protein TonB
MEINKILSADLLDLLFDERNKDYGAYELRKTYNKRISRALVITFSVAGLVLTGSVLASNFKPREDSHLVINELTLEDLPQDKIEEIPPPEKQPEPEPTRTEQFTNIVLAEVVEDPPPTQDDLQDANIGDKDMKGIDPTGVVEPPMPEVQNRVIDVPEREPDIWTKVEVEASFEGNWEKFLLRNLRADVPVENGAPAGRYRVVVRFVVDVDGTVSNIEPMTDHGFGMEKEAVRVLKKSDKWKPAFQNTKNVKAYRSQAITFEVLGDE